MTAFLEHALYRVFRFNPCLTANELRMRMRGSRLFLVLLFYTLIAAGAVLLALIPITIERSMAYGPDRLQVGRILFAVLAHTQLTLILLILPAYSAGTIAMEREKRTFEMLKASLLTPADIVSGKLLVILAVALMLLFTSLPVAAWCMFLGGIAPSDLFFAYTYLLAVAAFVSAVGIYFSATLSRSLAAIVATYGTLIGLAVLSVTIPSLLMMALTLGTGTAAYFGAGGALAVLVAIAALSGWLLFFGARSLLARLLPRLRRLFLNLLAAAALAAWLGLLYHLTFSLYSAISTATVQWIMVLNPYVALAGVMDGSFAQMLAGAPGPAPAANVNFYIWAVAGIALLTLAANLWVLSVRTLRYRY